MMMIVISYADYCYGERIDIPGYGKFPVKPYDTCMHPRSQYTYVAITSYIPIVILERLTSNSSGESVKLIIIVGQQWLKPQATP